MEYEKLFETKKISSKQGLTKQLVSLVLNQGKKINKYSRPSKKHLEYLNKLHEEQDGRGLKIH